jgi:adenine deaminase
MMNRRQFISAAAAGAAMVARIPNVLAQSIDLIIKGGRVIDPSIGLDAIRDIAIAGGRIVGVEPSIAGNAPDVIDARARSSRPA